MWQILHGIQPNPETPIMARSAFIEFQALAPDLDPTPPNMDHIFKTLDYARNLPSPRIIKSHLPLEMLPPKLLDTCKVVYVCRNVKDVSVSWYHHTFTCGYGTTGSYSDIAKEFLAKEVLYGDYWAHLKVNEFFIMFSRHKMATSLQTALSKKDHPNFHLIWYEDMKKDHRAELEKLCTFLDRPLSSEKLDQLQVHLVQ